MATANLSLAAQPSASPSHQMASQLDPFLLVLDPALWGPSDMRALSLSSLPPVSNTIAPTSDATSNVALTSKPEMNKSSKAVLVNSGSFLNHKSKKTRTRTQPFKLPPGCSITADGLIYGPNVRAGQVMNQYFSTSKKITNKNGVLEHVVDKFWCRICDTQAKNSGDIKKHVAIHLPPKFNCKEHGCPCPGTPASSNTKIKTWFKSMRSLQRHLETFKLKKLQAQDAELSGEHEMPQRPATAGWKLT